ncbi:hypothetical protein CHLRE_16g690800v5 [Chlamydomonas reinhardtii]|uniref:Uncharacterized protein n=1 Tax=Chlamydomonas reinhardtii TaxID=3055 RepID=A0A2K3CSP2_CHLRE|nr:uncharacterized protein CHLRE_16g690800v5 [Chlamydomonas reinhardtii]PNW71271.1 hypothetical protein CHLRE_16g690800v5 [Chlamydomonas reinhardtii]
MQSLRTQAAFRAGAARRPQIRSRNVRLVVVNGIDAPCPRESWRLQGQASETWPEMVARLSRRFVHAGVRGSAWKQPE